MTHRLLLERPSQGLTMLAKELDAACGYLARESLAPSHLTAARAIVDATTTELRDSLAELERMPAALAGTDDARGFRALIVALLQASAHLAGPLPDTDAADAAHSLVGGVANLLSWAATDLEIKSLPQTDEPLV